MKRLLLDLRSRIKAKVGRETRLWRLLNMARLLPRVLSVRRMILERGNYLFVRREGKKLLSWIPNTRRVEIELTTYCNLRCANCDRACTQAPSSERMSTGQIEKFVNESVQLKWYWWIIVLIGGEPTLHPQFFEILQIVKRYKEFNPHCNVWLATNGHGRKVQDVLAKVPDWVGIRNSSKEGGDQYFSAYSMAPKDSERYRLADFSKGCMITEQCGLGLTRHGYYPCGAGGGVDRVFGFDIGIKSLSEVRRRALRKQLGELCGYCGHFDSVDPGGPGKAEWVWGETKSISWQHACEKYKQQGSRLSPY
ncbi:MAG: radical SAM protein [Kiritimatiellae bacterium]|nr:radical SAM protein [Kiritimatiellia bacterium]